MVDAPKWGDPIHTLRKSLPPALDGTVYFRSQAVSRPATSAEHKLLEQRARRGQHQTPELSGLQVGFTISKPAAVLVVNPTLTQIDAWIQQRRAALLQHHEAVVAAAAAEPMGLVGDFFGPAVDHDAIEAHLQLCRTRLFDATRRMLVKGGYSKLTATVTNPGTRILEKVQLTVIIETPHSAFANGRADGLKPLPDPPKTKHKVPVNRAFLPPEPLRRFGLPALPQALNLPDFGIDIERGQITLNLGQIRPEKTVTTTEFHLFLLERPTDNQLRVAWTLTSTSAEGIQRGTSQIPVHPTQAVFLPAQIGMPDENDSG